MLGKKLVGAGPLGVLGGSAELLVGGELADFDDRAVGSVGKVVAVLVEFGNGREQIIDVIDLFKPRGRFKLVVSECLLEFRSARVRGIIDLAVGVKNTVKRARRYQF